MIKQLTFVLTLFVLLTGSAWSSPIATALEDLEGKPTTLESPANKVLVVFWATWCPSCRSEFSKELPELAKTPGIEIVTVNTDTDRERAKDYVTREKIPFKVFRDPSKAFRRSLKVFSVPHWAVYARKGASDWQLVTSQGAFDLAEVKRSLGAP
jgi:thiol-disulfide isomerase/thioredoxin